MKTITMKKQLSLAISLSALAFFAACSDNVTDNDPVATQAYDGQEDFPDCDKDYEGMFATVKSEKGLYICTASKWVNLTTGATVSDDGDGKNTGCTSKELDDKSGVKVICNGDSVAVLKYGKTGSKGSTGPSGDTGDKGSDGKDGSNGSSGSDAKIDPSRCLVKYSGYDVMIYDCKGDLYTQRGATTASYYRWLGIKLDLNFNGNAVETYYHDQFSTDASGKLVRFEGDDSWAPALLTAEDLKRDEMAIKGDASVAVSKNVTVSADKYHPFVGIRTKMTGNITAMAGMCLTYMSEKEMALLVEGESGFVKATVPASKDGESVYNVLWSDFAPVTKDADIEKVLSSAKAVYVEAVGGEKVGEYTNTFSVAQFGFYRACDGNTYKGLVARMAPSATGELEDKRQTPTVTYKTVTIGNQTWMAENLRYETTSSKCYYAGRNVTDAATLDGDDCSGNGRVYLWLDAIGSPAGCAEDANCDPELKEPVQGICPSGWHVPSMDEWGELLHFLFADYSEDKDYAQVALLAEYVEGEQYSSNNKGKNITGMNMKFIKSDELVWSIKERSTTEAYGFNFYDGYAWANSWDPYTGYHGTKATAMWPVRCVKDAEPVAP
jgi:uncharacterized protein (TIGR02145 family)